MAFQGASSSSSSSTRWWMYDVFLSFRGGDIRQSFTAHLYQALDRNKINTYIDYKLSRGEEISEELFKAIESSRISIVVFSENYASSRWCLDELVKIFECKETKKQMILPVFYRVLPSDVRHQRGSFGYSFAKLKERLKDESKVDRWKATLTKVAALSGFVSGNHGDEPNFIQEIVRYVSSVVKHKSLNVAKHPIGLESRVQDVHKLLREGLNISVRKLGIYGIGGVGKTSLAKMIYNSFLDEFEDSCFLANVRETSKHENGLIQLQKTLLCEILREPSLKVRNVDQGIDFIKKMLWDKRVLLVLDDLDQSVKIETLLGGYEWFGSGSIIIITTRDEHLLTCNDVHLRYKVKELNHDKALQLFCWNAFKNKKPNHDFLGLTEDVLHYVEGLPLALVILGSNLYDRDIHYWRSALEKYKKIPDNDIHEKLKISYDDLDESEKSIFLDIACFFTGEKEEYVTNVLDGCDFFPKCGMEVLVDRSLIAIEYGRLNMHDLLKDMGREIVRQESPNKLEERSRLWFHEDVRRVLEETKGTNKIQGILIELPEQGLIDLSPGAFSEMRSLRIFINRNGLFSREPDYLSNELRVLDWCGYPNHSFPQNFNGKKLIVLSMDKCLIKELGEGLKSFRNLKIMKFSECEFLRTIPDVSGLQNLERLQIKYCDNLVELHQSIGSVLDKLVQLKIHGCPRLASFPSSLKLRSLKMLCLFGCGRLQKFPEIGSEMKCLTKVQLHHMTAIKELPSSVGNLTGLYFLQIRNCLQQYLSREIQFLTGYYSTLVHLEISGSNVVILPEWIGGFDQLASLRLNDCKQLKKIPILPPNIEIVDARGCISLESFVEVSKRFEFNTSNCRKLYSIDLRGCHKMVVNPLPFKGHADWLLAFSGNKIPDWDYHRKLEILASYVSDDINVDLVCSEETKGIIICAIAQSDPSQRSSSNVMSIDIYSNDVYVDTILETSVGPCGGQKDVLLHYKKLDRLHFKSKVIDLQLKFHSIWGRVLITSIGIRLVRKQETNTLQYISDSENDDNENSDDEDGFDLEKDEEKARDDDTGVLHQEVGAHDFDASCKSIDIWVDSMDGKRRLGEDDCNSLEYFNWYYPKKRQCTSTNGYQN